MKITYVGHSSFCVEFEKEKIVLIFDYYKGENKIKSCQECGSLFKLKTSNSNKKYCDNCAKQIKLEQNMKKLIWI